MPSFLALIGGIQIGFAILGMVIAKSTFHENTAAILFGFGCVCLGLSRICTLLQNIDERGDKLDAARARIEYEEKEARENERVKSYKTKPDT